MGVEFVSTLQQSNRDFKATVTHDSFEIEENSDWGVGIYLLHGYRDGFYSHNDFSRSTSGLVDIANHLLKNQEKSIKEEPVDTIEQAIFDIRGDGPWSGDFETEIETISTHLQDIMKDYPEVKYEFTIEAKSVNKTVQNSFDVTISHKFDSALLDIILYDKSTQGNKIQKSIGGIQKTDFDVDKFPSIIDDSVKDLKGLRSASKVPPDNYNIILSPDSAYSMIHESIGHGTEADQILNDISFLSNRLGYKVGSSKLTITDDPHLRGNGWSEYDDEGTKTKGTLLVEDGILVDLLHTTQTAKMLDYPKTGNARSNSYLHKPEPRQSNIFVEPKDFSLDEMLSEISDGIYIGPSFVASTSIYSGEIHIESQFGRIINQGELGSYLGPVTITGNALSLLNKIKEVGDKITKFPTECLKSTSKINIGAYSPPLMLNDVYLQ